MLAARRDRSDVDRVREALNDPEELARALGLCEGAPRRDVGEWWHEGPGVIVRCPLHGGRSCHVFQGRDGGVGWTCYGCNEKGDALSLVAAVEGLDTRRDFAQVLQHAARIAGVAIDTGTSERAPRAPRPAPPPRRTQPERLDDVAFARVAAVLLSDPATALDGETRPACGECGACARCYLDGRALLPGALADGWRELPADEPGQRALVTRIVAAVGRETWERSGLARKSDPSRFVWTRNRLVIPWRDRAGRVTALQRRLIGTAHEGEHRYVQAGIVRDPYGAHRLRDGAPVAFVEGAADVIAFGCVFGDGRREHFAPEDLDVIPLGLPGAGAWRAEWGELARGREAVIGLDVDDNVRAAAAVQLARAAMRRDLDAHARSVQVFVPSVEGRRVKDWSDAWEVLRW